MLLSPKGGFAFVHIPKTGGTSVQRALARHARLADRLAYDVFVTRAALAATARVLGLKGEGKSLITGLDPHATLRGLEKKIGSEALDALFTFAVVRDPFDHLASRREHYLRHPRHHRHVLARETSFAEFVAWACGPEGPRPQAAWVKRRGRPGVGVDHLVRFETLSDGIAEVAGRLGLPAPVLPPPRTGTKRDLAALYDADSAARVRARFSEDFELFGYPGEPGG